MNVNRIRTTLEYLEKQIGDRPCPVCNGGKSAVLEPGDPAPPPCPACGTLPPTIQIVEDEDWYGNNAHELSRRRGSEELQS